LFPAAKKKVAGMVVLLTEAAALAYNGKEPISAGRCKESEKEFEESLKRLNSCLSKVGLMSERCACHARPFIS